jgi:hypothetical protein
VIHRVKMRESAGDEMDLSLIVALTGDTQILLPRLESESNSSPIDVYAYSMTLLADHDEGLSSLTHCSIANF